MKPAEREVLIQKNMKVLKISREEAEELIADDEKVDRGEALPWDLTPEQMKNARKLANVTTRKVSKDVKRTKKENPDKKYLIACLLTGIPKDEVENLKVTNDERSFDFTFNDVNYSISLTAHRK